jgi:hypothetical protein
VAKVAEPQVIIREPFGLAVVREDGGGLRCALGLVRTGVGEDAGRVRSGSTPDSSVVLASL